MCGPVEVRLTLCWLGFSRGAETCARALDLASGCTVPVLFHVDDPVFLASSRGKANRVLRVISSWCGKYKASLHMSTNKTVAMVLPERPLHAILKSSALNFYTPG